MIHRKEDFKSGFFYNIRLNDRGQMYLKDEETYGEYISFVLDVKDFHKMVVSWNGFTPKNTQIEVMAKVRVGGVWSRWFSYGKWSLYGKRCSIQNQKDTLAQMSIDQLEVLGEKVSDGLQYKVCLLRQKETDPPPAVELVAFALTYKEPEPMEKVCNKNWLIDLPVPLRSQRGINDIGNRICSPTSLAMVLEYWGHRVDTMDAALGVYDYDAKIYGNWVFNTAYAGSFGLEAYVAKYHSIEEVKEKIVQGRPVVASIRTLHKEELKGSPCSYPSGHLVVIRGFEKREDGIYVLVNDPAAEKVEEVKRAYPLEQFKKAWNGIVYIL